MQRATSSLLSSLLLLALLGATVSVEMGCDRVPDEEPTETKTSAYTIHKSALVAVNTTNVWVETSTTTFPYLGPSVLASSENFSGATTTLVADVNNDTWSDLIAVGPSSISVKLAVPALASPKFANATPWSSEAFTGTKGVLAADVDGDGNADLIAWNDTTISLKKSTGTTLLAKQTLPAEPFAGTTNLAADVNGDGKADLIAWSPDLVKVRLANGTDFAPAQTWSTQLGFSGTRTNVVGDVNGDGKADLIAWSDTATLVKLSTGMGFGTAVGWSNVPFAGARANLAGDLNQDGRADLIAVNDLSTWVMISSGTGFGPSTQVSSTPFWGGVGTYVANLAQPYTVQRSALIAVSADQTWVQPSLSEAPYFGGPVKASAEAFGGTKMLVADVNGDTWSDLVAVNAASVSVKTALPNLVNPGFAGQLPWSSEAGLLGTRGTLLGDTNKDGKADLIIWNDTEVKVKLSNGSGFDAAVQRATGLFYGNITNLAVDLNRDGYVDLVAWNDHSVYRKLGSASGFDGGAQWSTEMSFFGTTANLAGDVNADGQVDLIAISPGSVKVKISTGIGLSASTIWSSSPKIGNKANLVGDVNQDGRADLIAVSDTAPMVAASFAQGNAFVAAVDLSSKVPFYGSVGTYVGTFVTPYAGSAPVAPPETSTTLQVSMTPSTPRAATSARDNNGAITVYALNASGAPVTAPVTSGATGVTWSAMGSSGATGLVPLASAPVVAATNTGPLEALARGADGAIWRVSQSGGTWGTWASLGVQSASAPALARDGAGVLHAFVVGVDSTMMHATKPAAAGSAWSTWANVGGGTVLRSDPVALADATASRYVFALARGTDEGLWETHQTSGPWSTSRPLGGVIKGNFAATLNSDDAIDVVAVDYRNDLTHITLGKGASAWGAWTGLARNRIVSGLSAIRRASGRLEIVGVGLDRQVWRLAQAAPPAWNAWQALGPSNATSSPLIVETSDQALSAFVRQANLQLGRSNLPANGSVWTSWTGSTTNLRLPSHDPPSTAAQTAVLTQHNDNGRTGAMLNETKLNAFNVSPHQFGVLFRRRVDGDVYAQPLFVPQIDVHDNSGVDKGIHDVVIVATSRNTVYAFDANDPQAFAPLWSVNLGESAPLPNRDFGNGNRPDGGAAVGTCQSYKEFNNPVPSDSLRRVVPNHAWYNLREIGIIGTPVVDVATNTLYVVTFGIDPMANTPHDCMDFSNCTMAPCASGTGKGYSYKLHALDLTTHTARPGVPAVTLSADLSVVDGLGSVGGHLTFSARLALQRSALLLATSGGKKAVFIAFSGIGDVGDYHGWLLAHDATTLLQVGAYSPTALKQPAGSPTLTPCPPGQVCRYGLGSGGGIWQSGQGPAADGTGNVYVATGNGDFFWSSTTSTGDLSDAVIKMTLNPGLSVQSFFEPKIGFTLLNGSDNDLGSSGPMLVPGTDRLVQGSKTGAIYMLNTGNLGGFSPTGDQNPQTFQASTRPDCSGGPSNIHGSPIFWKGPDKSRIYVWGEEDFLKSYALLPALTVEPDTGPPFNCGFGFEAPRGKVDSQNSQISTAVTTVIPTAKHVGTMPGGALSVSAQGSLGGSGVVWATRPLSGTALFEVPAGIIEAYDATNLGTKLWDSATANEDALGPYARYAAPTVANGKVYVATFSRPNVLDDQGVPISELVVYGPK